MAGYTKLFSTIVHSTVWREEMHVKVVWVTMLALANRKGVVEASVPGLADAARVSVEQGRDALRRLSEPDPDSRTKDFGGRRIEAVDGGWQLLNYLKYRQLLSKEEERIKTLDRVRKHRAKSKSLKAVTVDVTQETESNEEKRPETGSNAPLRQAEATSTAEAKAITATATDLRSLGVAERFVAVFNQALKRSCHITPPVEERLKERLLRRDEWEILALPILIAAAPPPREILDRLTPLMILRDGKHPRMTAAGYHAGGTDWLEERISRIDTTTLGPRLAAIAEAFGVLKPLTDLRIRVISAEAV